MIVLERHTRYVRPYVVRIVRRCRIHDVNVFQRPATAVGSRSKSLGTDSDYK